MQQFVTVRVRPSDQTEGQQEQAIYILGGINDGANSSSGSLYDSKYNLVTIVGSTPAWTSNWESPPLDADGNPLTNSSGGTYNPQRETFVGEELPDYLNENFSVDKTGNAIVGLSMSGGQAANLALKYPEVFKVAMSISGYYQTNNPVGWMLIPYILSQRQGISNGFDGLWGNPLLAGNKWADNDVAGRLFGTKDNDQTFIISTGNGLIASQAEWDELMALGGIGEAVMGSALEFVSFVSAGLLDIEAKVFGLPVEFIYTDGAHTWQRWRRTEAEQAEKLQDALEKYQTPSTSAAPTEAAQLASSSETESANEPAIEADIEADATPTSETPAAVAEVTEDPEATEAPMAEQDPAVDDSSETVPDTEPVPDTESAPETEPATGSEAAAPEPSTATAEPASEPTESASDASASEAANSALPTDGADATDETSTATDQ